MPFINQAMNEAKETEAVPDDLDCTLRVISVSDPAPTKNDPSKQQLIAVIAISHPDYPNAQTIRHYMGVVGENDDAGASNMKLLAQRRFCEAFGVEYEESGWNTDDAVGQELETKKAGVRIRRQENMDVEPSTGQRTKPTGTFSNSLQFPRLKEEAEAPQAKRRAGRR